MKYVNLNIINYDVTIKTIFKFILNENNTITVEKKSPNATLDLILINNEFIIGEDGKRFSIKKDGIKFLENLKFAFTGSVLRASDIIEE